jgi:hypothetical protein
LNVVVLVASTSIIEFCGIRYVPDVAPSTIIFAEAVKLKPAASDGMAVFFDPTWPAAQAVIPVTVVVPLTLRVAPAAPNTSRVVADATVGIRDI